MSDIKKQVAEKLEAVSIGGDIGLATSQIHELYMEQFEKMLPVKSQTQATKNGVWYESEFDEGYNACLAEIKDKLGVRDEN